VICYEKRNLLKALRILEKRDLKEDEEGRGRWRKRWRGSEGIAYEFEGEKLVVRVIEGDMLIEMHLTKLRGFSTLQVRLHLLDCGKTISE